MTASKEDYWGNIVSVIEFEKGQLESAALKGLEDFSHVEVLFHLSDVPQSSETTIEFGAKVVIARGPHKGLRYVHLGDGACAGAESSGKSRGKSSFGGIASNGDGSWEDGIIRRIHIGTPPTVGQ